MCADECAAPPPLFFLISYFLFRATTKVHEIVMRNREVIDAEVKHERDFSFDYFGFKVSGNNRGFPRNVTPSIPLPLLAACIYVPRVC